MIRVLALDIDGVLTDGKVTLDESGHESKVVSYQDIEAIFRAQRQGISIALVTGEASPWVAMIARRLEVKHLYQGAKNKREALETLCEDLGVDLNEVCYVGDSPRDVEALTMVGLALAPRDASSAAQAVAHRLLEQRGGNGAVAEAIEILLQTQTATELSQSKPGKKS